MIERKRNISDDIARVEAMDQLSCTKNGEESLSNQKDHPPSNDFEEIHIPVPWGHLAGKWWGPTHKRPILALHGWQDNAGTFDKLAPLIAKLGHSVLCIDLPGHGLSSPYPSGMYYYVFWDGLQIVKRIMQHYKWSKTKLMGHSLGGIIAFVFASAFPDEVDFFVALDIASPAIRDPAKLADQIGPIVAAFLKYEKCSTTMQQSNEYEEMVQTAVAGYNGSCTREAVEILLRRGMKAVGNNKYVFTRDVRLKAIGLAMVGIEEALAMASQIKCPVLNIRANPGMKFEKPEYYNLVLDALERSSSDVERHIVNGKHHVHLNDVQSVATIVTNFLTRHN